MDNQDYVKDALEMAGIDLEKPKQIVTEVSGFVPMFDAVIEQYHDHTRAAVHGAVWRFCQMEDGVCKASLQTIADWIGVNKTTAQRHLEVLVEDGYFVDLTPDLVNKPHVYADTGKVVMVGSFKARVAQRNAGVAQRNAGVAQSRLTKDSNKDSKKGDLVDAILQFASPKEQAEREATSAFESAFGFGSLPWRSTSVWDKMAVFVTSVHQQDAAAFRDYVAWRANGGKFVAMSNKQIRQSPQMLIDTGWPEFEAARLRAPRPAGTDTSALEKIKQEEADAVPPPAWVTEKAAQMRAKYGGAQ